MSRGEKDDVRIALLFVVVALLLVSGCSQSVSLSGPTPATAPTVTITGPSTWIIWGQSNAIGHAPGPSTVPSSGVEAWDHRWTTSFSEPLPFTDGCPGAVCDSGWAVMAANMAGHPVRLTGHGRGATAISYWLSNPRPLLDNLIDAKDASWLITYHGESDALANSQTYTQDLARLVSMVRQATNPRLRVLVIGLSEGPSQNQAQWDRIREQQQAYVSSDPLAVFITAQGLDRQYDQTHLSRQGNADLAARVISATLERP